MTGDLKSFELDLHKAAEALDAGFGDALKRTFFSLCNRVTERTPRDFGTASGNWQAEKGTDSPTFHQESDFKGSRAASTAKVMQSVAGIDFTDPYNIFWCSNFLPYIELLEFGGYPNPPKRGSWDRKKNQWVIKTTAGFSNQAPAGMLRLSISDTENEVNTLIEQEMRAKGF